MAFKRKPPDGNVRRVQTNGTGVRGVITNKAGRIVQFESFAERSLLLRLDRDPNVTDYRSQPEQIVFKDEKGKEHRYVPDFQVWYEDGGVALHEVSMSHRQQRGKLQARHQAAHQLCEHRGWQFVLHSEADLPTGSELANLLALWRYRPRRYLEQTVWDYMVMLLDDGQIHTLTDIAHQIATNSQHSLPVVASTLYHALWHGDLCMNWDQLLFLDAMPHPEATIWLAKGGVK